MAKLSAKKRNALPKSAFALPGQRKYPLVSKGHGLVALRESMSPKTAGSYSTVRAAVNKKFSSLRGKGPGAGGKRTGKR